MNIPTETEVKDDNAGTLSPPLSPEKLVAQPLTPARIRSTKITAFALGSVCLYMGIFLGILVIGILPFRFSRDFAYLSLAAGMTVLSILMGALYTNAAQRMSLMHSGATSVAKWFRLFSISAFALFPIVASLGLRFFISMVTSSKPWSPSPSEAVLVPLSWFASLSLPLSGYVLWRNARGAIEKDSSSASFRKAFWTWAAIGSATAVVLLAGFVSSWRPRQYAQVQTQLQVAERLAESEDAQRRLMSFENRIETPADVADVPFLDLLAEDDPSKRYLLIGLKAGQPVPEKGYRVLVVLPGGAGGSDFSPFIRRVYKKVLNDRWLVAQLVAPKWDDKQQRTLVWPTAQRTYPGAKFSTEIFVDAVLADLRSRMPVDPARVYLFAWSSGGPAAYAVALQTNSPVTGSFIAMSIFPSDDISPALKSARGKAFFFLQSPEDKLTRFAHAEGAKAALEAAGAKVHLQQYIGGHGFHGGWGLIASGIQWLEEQSDQANLAEGNAGNP